MKKLNNMLKVLGACEEAIGWCGDKTPAQAWNECERADWMLWICGKMIGKKGWPNRKRLVLAACACAKTALKYWENKYPDDKRPHHAIKIAEKWAHGNASLEEVKAYAACADAAAAYAAAYDAARNKSLREISIIVRTMLTQDVKMLGEKGKE